MACGWEEGLKQRNHTTVHTFGEHNGGGIQILDRNVEEMALRCTNDFQSTINLAHKEGLEYRNASFSLLNASILYVYA